MIHIIARTVDPVIDESHIDYIRMVRGSNDGRRAGNEIGSVKQGFAYIGELYVIGNGNYSSGHCRNIGSIKFVIGEHIVEYMSRCIRIIENFHRSLDQIVAVFFQCIAVDVISYD